VQVGPVLAQPPGDRVGGRTAEEQLGDRARIDDEHQRSARSSAISSAAGAPGMFPFPPHVLAAGRRS
jgi:hypothetical protein